ncbi:uncharacterized protein PAC_19643 [Phialocephala subalpina]|uniref:Ricin B lectin domain-containing protein n=1 Tax=Phialocephala subalpina TaxID=576137 RepID=A0A1L7XXF8_9HELO|nr:uncharacterized protein PAC_19643 [Phialocephala subalpina]
MRQNLGYKPYEQYKQDEPFINELRAPITSPRARICGLTTRTFWIVFVIVLVVLGAAVGGGVGGGLAASHSTMTSPQGQSSSTASSPTSASSTSSSPYSTASSTATSSSIAPFSTAPGTYRIINIATNTAVDLLFGGTTNGTRIDGWSWNPASSPTQYVHQSWQMASVDNGAVIMYNTQTKSYITAPSNLTAGTNPPNTDDAGLYGGVPGDPSDAHTQWVIVPNSDNSIRYSPLSYSSK